MTRTNEEWLAALRGPDRDAAVAELYDLLRRAARSELGRRAARTGLIGSDIDELAPQAASDAAVAVLAKLDTFRGDSRFTTWAYAFAVFEVSAAVGRHLRRTGGGRSTVALDDDQWAALPDRWGAAPDEQVQAAELVALLRRTVDLQLTPRQQRVFRAVVVEGVPLDVLVDELGSNRNAIYKMVFDARRKIRDAFVANGYMDQAVGR